LYKTGIPLAERQKMTPIDSAGISIATTGLLIGPLIALCVFAVIQSRWAFAARPVAIVCITTIIFIAVAASLGFSFRNVLLNIAFFAIAYGAYCFLANCCWRIRYLPLRIVALLCAAVPICAGYLVGTIGILGLAFIVGDYTRAPYNTEQIEAGLECRVTGWGMVGSASGYTVHLYRSWDWLPLIERSVARIPVVQIGYDGDTPPKDANCADAVARYRS
jgi:hypothetical protein